nr:hypothetical protein [uncultured Draconibacterium sp.]
MQNNNFHYRMIKARVAETIIKELFQYCGYNVYEHGMERSMPTIAGKLNYDTSDTAMQIRKMPDFVVQAPPPINKLHYVEVKYRKACDFPVSSDLIKDYPYTNAWFIIVSKKDIRCISCQQILAGEDLRCNDSYLLENVLEFGLDKKLVKQFTNYAVRFFEGVE